MDLWAALLEQTKIARQTIINGGKVVPSWCIGASDGPWHIATRLHHSHPAENERIVRLVGRFLAWKRAESFILVGVSRLGFITPGSTEEAIVTIANCQHGLRLVSLERIRREPTLSFIAPERCDPDLVEVDYWMPLPQGAC